MNSQAELRRYFKLGYTGHECHFDAFLEAGRTAKNLLRSHEINFIGSVENQNVDPHIRFSPVSPPCSQPPSAIECQIDPPQTEGYRERTKRFSLWQKLKPLSSGPVSWARCIPRTCGVWAMWK